ncbi:MAG TPA: DUF362 domain-containing protein [Candidatus Bathyarchaeia archaeon]|nr:DUF362 domain-containing protein [Candidatus Bathyarchaeia archaeon]
MNKVYFLKGFSRLESVSKKLLAGFYRPKSKILVKLHFGEPGNQTAFFPKDIKPIVNALKSLKLKPILIDTPVVYNSLRNTVEGYTNVLRQRGFDKLAPFVISDQFIKVKTKDFTAEVCRELVEANGVLVVSHVKGHGCSGFGGAIKNLGMGGVSKKTKGIEHDLSKPKFVSACRGCGTCASVCPAGAIKMLNDKAEIDLKRCYGCSLCGIVCPYKCLAPKKRSFDDLLAQGAAAVINHLPPKTFYVNVIKNVTKDCDCATDSGKIVAGDLGVLFSENPVAIDKASIDLLRQANKREVFEEITHKNPLLHVNYTAGYIGNNLSYSLLLVS